MNGSVSSSAALGRSAGSGLKQLKRSGLRIYEEIWRGKERPFDEIGSQLAEMNRDRRVDAVHANWIGMIQFAFSTNSNPNQKSDL